MRKDGNKWDDILIAPPFAYPRMRTIAIINGTGGNILRISCWCSRPAPEPIFITYACWILFVILRRKYHSPPIPPIILWLISNRWKEAPWARNGNLWRSQLDLLHRKINHKITLWRAVLIPRPLLQHLIRRVNWRGATKALAFGRATCADAQ